MLSKLNRIILAYFDPINNVLYQLISGCSNQCFCYTPNSLVRCVLQFAEAPGAERLAMESEVLRIREGPILNKSLLSFAAALRSLQYNKAVDSGASVMTRLLSESLGANSLTLVIGTVRQGDWESSEAVLRHLQVGREAHVF